MEGKGRKHDWAERKAGLSESGERTQPASPGALKWCEEPGFNVRGLTPWHVGTNQRLAMGLPSTEVEQPVQGAAAEAGARVGTQLWTH